MKPCSKCGSTERNAKWGYCIPCEHRRSKERRERLWRAANHIPTRVMHGKWGTPEYNSYKAAKNRCNNPNVDSYPDYGGRGIKFLFTDVEQFIAHVGMRPSNAHSLDRIDSNGNYEPGNVRWALAVTQANNQRNRMHWKRFISAC